jgi:rubrerythrin
MTRRLLNLLTVLSLLLCVAVCVLWVRSRWGRDQFEFVWNGARWEVVSGRWGLWLSDRPQKNLDDASVDQLDRKWKEEHQQLHNEVMAVYSRPAGDPGSVEARERMEDMDRAVRRMARVDEANEAAVRKARVKARVPTAFYSVPHALPAAVAAVAPAVWVTLAASSRLRRRHRIDAHLCLRCGYNLTGNVSGVCPECGAVRA